MTVAFPFASVVPLDEERLPAVVVNETTAALSALPLISSTLARTVVVPPLVGRMVGFADRFTRPTAAAPTEMRRLRSEEPVVVPPVPVPELAPPVDVVAPPELALITATPLAPDARKVTDVRPLASVLASGGSMTPSVVVKVTRVPLWGGVPADSRTCATIVAEPLAGIAFVPEVNVIDEPVGASSGAFSQATIRSAAITDTAARNERVKHGIM